MARQFGFGLLPDVAELKFTPRCFDPIVKLLDFAVERLLHGFEVNEASTSIILFAVVKT
jgi:hypothetical protein